MRFVRAQYVYLTYIITSNKKQKTKCNIFIKEQIRNGRELIPT